MSERGKTVLIVGNGFDLAHGLPTKYMDFLEFCIRVEVLWRFELFRQNKTYLKKAFQKKWIEKWDMENSVRDYILNVFQNRKYKYEGLPPQLKVKIEDEVFNELYELIHENIWYCYFSEIYKKKYIRGENWIDFEFEIRYIIQQIDENSENLNDEISEIFKIIIERNRDDKMNLFIDVYRGRTINEDDKQSIRLFRQIIYRDLERITRALELYLGKFINMIIIDKRIPEIDRIKPDYVINFNYTNTYERVYKNATVFHIHGNCDIDRAADKNNMVLGIDEYWEGNDRNLHTNFTIFKKFAQRIQKNTGIENYKYLNEINKHFEKNKEKWSGNVDISTTHPKGISYVHIFGHSLDITDKDILAGFVGAESTSVTVYCYDKGTEGELIVNTIKLIGEELLLKKINNVPPKLNYVIQEED